MGGYQTALIGLCHGIFFVVVYQKTPMPAKFNRSVNRILIIFIFQTRLYHQVYQIMLPVYIYHKDGTFLNKTGLFHASMSHSLRVPVHIVKYVKNGHFIFRGAIKFAREA